MPKNITMGNGKILIGLDNRGQVRDFYFPYVGLENHISGHHVHRIGVWADNAMHWFDNPSWDININCDSKTSTCFISARNDSIGIQVTLNDIVYNEKNVFIREVKVLNLQKKKRTIKIFFAQQFRLSESRLGDTGYYDPRCNAVIHYKGKRAFLINVMSNKSFFNEYSIGLFEMEGKEGTHADAEDGVLSQNPIEHGSVDSVVGMTLDLDSKGENVLYYWIAVGESILEVQHLNTHILNKTPQHIIKTTNDYWHAWVNRQNFSFYGLSDGVINLFKKSLLIARSHADNGGAIIASGDSDMLQGGRDTYSYVWPRDGAITANALDRAGSVNVARRFYEFCNKVVSDEGYFMHKYRPDGSLGSSWLPWIRDGKAELPIQEDETAIVLCMLWKHYEYTKDLEFIEELYNSLIKKSADFIANFIHKETGLPYPSYDLWEEKYGISTYTCGVSYAALIAAARFAKLLGKIESEQKYLEVAKKMKAAAIKYLYCEDIQMFCKLIYLTDKGMEYDKTIDMSSFYGIFRYEMLDVSDELMQKSIRTIEEKLCLKTEVSGVPRYEGDRYYQVNRHAPPNPWFITTLWLTQFYIQEAKTEKDLDIVKKCFEWVNKYALPSGVLSEQINPYSGKQLSASPLTWSHAEFITTVIDYLEKLEELGICKACSPMKH